jgi:hypothetical protein
MLRTTYVSLSDCPNLRLKAAGRPLDATQKAIQLISSPCEAESLGRVSARKVSS